MTKSELIKMRDEIAFKEVKSYFSHLPDADFETAQIVAQNVADEIIDILWPRLLGLSEGAKAAETETSWPFCKDILRKALKAHGVSDE